MELQINMESLSAILAFATLGFVYTRTGIFGSSEITLRDRVDKLKDADVAVSYRVKPTQNFFLFSKFDYDVKEQPLTGQPLIGNKHIQETRVSGYTVRPVKIEHVDSEGNRSYW